MSAEHADASTDERLRAVLGRPRRVAAAVLGGALLVSGLKRRSLGGSAAAAVGGWLLYRGLRGGDSSEEAFDAADVADRETEADAPAEAGVERSHAVTVGKPADELYERWRDPETVARLLGGFAETTAPGEGRLGVAVDGPLGRRWTWDAELVEDRPGELLRWESLSAVPAAVDASVRFRPAPGDRGTEVTLSISVDPAGGTAVAAAVDRLGFVPGTLALKLLRRFKSLAETGEIPTLERNPSGRGRGDLL